MNVSTSPEGQIARIAAAMGDTARSRMLFALMSGHARTATELALVAEITPATASAHLQRLLGEQLVRVVAQGKHRYYSLHDERVADVLESLTVLAGRTHDEFVPSTPDRLRAARTCYDHLAGTLAVALHDRLLALEWLTPAREEEGAYALSEAGAAGLSAIGVDIEAMQHARRRLAFACMDWSERRAHVGGAVGAELLSVALRRKWVARERSGRAVRITAIGTRDFARYFGVRLTLDRRASGH